MSLCLSVRIFLLTSDIVKYMYLLLHDTSAYSQTSSCYISNYAWVLYRKNCFLQAFLINECYLTLGILSANWKEVLKYLCKLSILSFLTHAVTSLFLNNIVQNSTFLSMKKKNSYLDCSFCKITYLYTY